MEILILGIGGFDNSGFPFNSFIVDRHILVESPPDILQSLKREGIDRNKIDTIVISHTHGDHIFGLPFLLYNLFKQPGWEKKIRIIGPAGTRETLVKLAGLAIRDDHPSIGWIDDFCEFIVVDEKSRLAVGPYEIETYRMVHEKETYGAGFFDGGILQFQYLPDTKWDDRLLPYFAKKSRVILCDVNGSGGNNAVHMSVNDLERNLRGKIGKETRIIGTHINTPIDPPPHFMEIAAPGMIVRI
jgi:phosphoribosyl 1,2-cyclic phosphodiesterase